MGRKNHKARRTVFGNIAKWELYICIKCRKNKYFVARKSECRSMGHLKSIWCPFCKDQTSHVRTS